MCVAARTETMRFGLFRQQRFNGSHEKQADSETYQTTKTDTDIVPPAQASTKTFRVVLPSLNDPCVKTCPRTGVDCCTW